MGTNVGTCSIHICSYHEDPCFRKKASALVKNTWTRIICTLVLRVKIFCWLKREEKENDFFSLLRLLVRQIGAGADVNFFNFPFKKSVVYQRFFCLLPAAPNIYIFLLSGKNSESESFRYLSVLKA